MTSTLFSKAWAIMILLLVIFTSMFVGMDLARGDWQGAIINGILLAFWVFAAVWFHFMAIREVKLDAELDQSKKDFDKSMEKLLAEIFGTDHNHHKAHAIVKDVSPKESKVHADLSDTLVDIIAEVSDGSNPEEKHFAEIKKRFEAKTGHEVIISSSGLGLNVKIGKQPMAKKAPASKPATKKAPVKKPVAKKAPVTKKTVTKKGK